MKVTTKPNNDTTFKISHRKLDDCLTGYEFEHNAEKIKITTEYPNPRRCEGFLYIWISVDGNDYYRHYEDSISQPQLVNFLNKFVNNKDYREQYFVGKSTASTNAYQVNI